LSPDSLPPRLDRLRVVGALSELLCAEPTRSATGAELLLLGRQLRRGRIEGAGPLGAGEEADVDAGHPAVAELDLAGATAAAPARRPGAAELGEQGLGDDATGALGEDAGLGHARGGDVADRVDTGELGPQRRRIDRDVAVLGDAAGDDDVWRAV